MKATLATLNNLLIDLHETDEITGPAFIKLCAFADLLSKDMTEIKTKINQLEEFIEADQRPSDEA